MTTDNALRACPFCGHKDSLDVNYEWHNNDAYVMCGWCGCDGPSAQIYTSSQDKDVLIDVACKLWNGEIIT